MLRNEKAQALVEFVLLLPIFLLLLLGMIDIGNLFSKRSELDNQVSEIISVWKKENQSLLVLKNSLEQKNKEVTVIENTNTKFITIEVSEKVNALFPILDNHKISVKKVVPLEQ